VFFKPGKSFLRAGQKLAIRDLVDSLQGRNAIEIGVVSRRHNSTEKRLGKKRNTAVVRYLRSLGVQATFSRSNIVGKGRSAEAKKNNRVTLKSTWTNPVT
jgi:outer membrane protein OmpA-like peptidoglycan-associated protein